MAGLQKLTIIGNLGHDPEMRYLNDGTPVLTFSVAVNRKITPRDGGEARELTDWFRVSVWRELAEALNPYLTKGTLVYVEGPETIKEFTRRDGTPGYGREVNASVVRMLGGGRRAEEGEGSGEREGEAADDLPF